MSSSPFVLPLLAHLSFVFITWLGEDLIDAVVLPFVPIVFVLGSVFAFFTFFYNHKSYIGEEDREYKLWTPNELIHTFWFVFQSSNSYSHLF